MPFLDFTAGQVLTADQVDNFLMRQAVMVFDDAASRDTALNPFLTEGMLTYLKDDGTGNPTFQYYDGSAWTIFEDLPNIAGQTGAYLFTDGTNLVWDELDGDDIPQLTSGTAGQTVISDGSAGVTYQDTINPFLLMGA